MNVHASLGFKSDYVDYVQETAAAQNMTSPFRSAQILENDRKVNNKRVPEPVQAFLAEYTADKGTSNSAKGSAGVASALPEPDNV